MIHAVTGATGHLGRLAVTSLLAHGVAADEIVAIGRNTERLAELAELGVTTRVADYSDRASLDAALAGVDRLLLVSGSEVGQRVPQHLNVIDAAKAAGVDLVAYTSIPNADTSGMALAQEHLATEQALAASGIRHTFLRNGWYLENYTEQLPTHLEHGAILGSAGDGRVSAATRADLAEAAALALLAEDPKRVLELGGAAFSLTELAATVSAETGREVAYVDLPAEEFARTLAGAGVPEAFAQVLADSDLGLARGELLVEGDDLAELLGRPATTLVEAVRGAAALV